jgi:hypothetical protein
LGYGAITTDTLGRGAVATVAVEARITVSILFPAGTGPDWWDGEFLHERSPTSTTVVFVKTVFPSTVIGVAATTGAACLIAPWESATTLSFQ